MMLWHDGNTSDVFTGVGANGNVATPGTYSYNTIMGFQSGYNNQGDSNTFNGYVAGYSNSGNGNTSIGAGAGYGLAGSNLENVFVGANAGSTVRSGSYNTCTGFNTGYELENAVANTFTGFEAGYFTRNGGSNCTNIDQFPNVSTHTECGSFNTFTGYLAGYFNVSGYHDDFYGKRAGCHNVDGADNCYYGSHSDFWNQDGDSNVMMGYDVGFNQMGGGNTYLGYEAGAGTYSTIASKIYSLATQTSPYTSYGNIFLGEYSAPSCQNGDYNIVIGSFADANGPLYNSATIGYKAVSEFNGEFILGNNSNMVGIGLSGNTTAGPQANLEICTTRIQSDLIIANPHLSQLRMVI